MLTLFTVSKKSVDTIQIGLCLGQSQEAGALRIRQIKTNPTHKSHQNPPPPPSPTPFLLINEVYISAMANAESGTTILCDDKRGKNIFRT